MTTDTTNNWTDEQLICDEADSGEQAHAMVRRQLADRGITDARVLSQMRRIPRHLFVGPAMQRRAYHDCALPTLNNQTISQPYVVALMSQMLQADPADRILEIGTGSGYQTMILAALGERVISIERDAQLADQARRTLADFGIANVQVVTGDGTLGWPNEAPYQRVLITAAAPHVPPPIVEQLSDGGRIVAPLGDRMAQYLTSIEKQGDQLRQVRGLAVRFVPLVGDEGWRPD
jgi:protein-L-isoaspartate(D-aspartate) O-methyltransferase